VTWGFLYLFVFLGGFTLALVTGLVRRILHPSELCDHVVVPSHEHWHSHHSPRSDLAISSATFFGLATLLVHGVSSFDPAREIAIGVVAGLIGAVVVRFWLGRIHDPIHRVEKHPENAVVVREIPANGFGQIEVTVAGSLLKLAAKSSAGIPIESGTVVAILDRQESVVVVSPTNHG
jgi:hypothetical protein